MLGKFNLVFFRFLFNWFCPFAPDVVALLFPPGARKGTVGTFVGTLCILLQRRRLNARMTITYRLTRRSRSALPITETELKLMAAAAIIGLSRTPKNG